MKNKKPLYIFLHIQKCAGSTVRKHIEKNFNKDEFLLAYANEPPFINGAYNLKKYLKSLTQKQKNKLKIIFGHRVFYKMGELFPGREIKYLTVFRSPIERMISQYNYRRMRLKQRLPKKSIDRLKLELLDGKRILDFHEWLEGGVPKNSIFRFVFERFFDKETNFSTFLKRDFKKQNLEKVKKILDSFYFVGIQTKIDRDILYIYSLLGINKFYSRSNVSKKYFIQDDSKEIEKYILSKKDHNSELLKFDFDLYSYVLKLNEKFKKEHTDFDSIVKKIGLKKRKYLGESFFNNLLRFFKNKNGK